MAAIARRGLPIESGRIQFSPHNGNPGPVAWGKIAKGRYQISRGEGPGEGEYRVTVYAGELKPKASLIRAPQPKPAKNQSGARVAAIPGVEGKTWREVVRIPRDTARVTVNVEL